MRINLHDGAGLFLTVVDDENEIVRSFDNGAADYITKPFRLRKLLARIKRTLHAGNSSDSETAISLGDALPKDNENRCFGQTKIGT